MRAIARIIAGLFIVVMSLVGMAVTADALFFTDPADTVTGSYAVDGPGMLTVYADESAVFNGWTCETHAAYGTVCAPSESPDGAAINASIEEDGSAHYADDSVFDPETQSFVADDVNGGTDNA